MLDWLIQLDVTVFRFVNSGLANPVTDAFMPIITNDYVLRTLLIVSLAVLLWRGDRKIRWSVLFAVITVGLTDATISGVLKHFINRVRPCHVLDGVHLLVNCGAGLSMPSAHAANSFGLAAFYGIPYPRARWYLVGLAVVIALSRVFCGVHYPGDIIVGAILGFAIGSATNAIFRRIFARFSEKSDQTSLPSSGVTNTPAGT